MLTKKIGGGMKRLCFGASALALALALNGAAATINWYVPREDYSIARNWSERALEGIRMDTPHPPGQARNLFSFSTCMYDAWAAYDPNAVGFVYRQKHTAANVAEARRTAISYAMYRMMVERHAFSRTAMNQVEANPAFMRALGYDPDNVSRDTSTAIGVGNSIYDAVSAWFIEDGSRQTAGTPYPTANPPVAYPDYPVGDPRRLCLRIRLLHGIDDRSGNTVVDVNVWQRLIVAGAIDQNGFPQNPLQGYLGGPWLWVRSFSLTRSDENRPWIDPGPPPLLGGARDAEFKENLVAVIRASSQLTTQDGVTIDISPRTIGNNTLGANDGTGYTSNPVTGQPYAPRMVLRGDFTRALTEFWADGPSSETPPGHWNSIANHVSDDMGEKRIAGTGPVVDRLEWDVKMYFALNAALHDAACAAWSVKRYYNAWRPISAIRYCAMQGQSSDPNGPHYSARGLPLVPGLIELVTDETAQTYHQGLTVGKIAVYSWPGQPEFPAEQTSGVKWVHGEDWMTYQKKTFVTPGFPGYISGHSTFSRSAAEVMTAFTGTKWFPGGLGTYTLPSLANEVGPTAPVTLEWASYFDAADQVGLSRIWGGIHPPADDRAGRLVGSQVGQSAWNQAKKFYDGTVVNTAVNMTARKVDDANVSVEFNTVRGLYYKVHTADSAQGPYAPGASQRAMEGSISATSASGGNGKFFQVSASVNP